MLVKICGIQTIEAADVAIQAGADLLGFVFAPSKRQITPFEAARIVKATPASIQTVGVFVNESVDNIKYIAELVGLDIIQLHGDESPAILKQLPYKTIKAFPIDQITPKRIQSFPCDYYLIDSPVGIHRGGSGKVFDWQLATDLGIEQQKLFLAGGLTPENVNTAIKTVNPVGVDVSSGVESNGIKDHDKIKQFITNAKG